jgi:N-acetylneuraminate synthase
MNLTVGDRQIGPGHPCFVIAEVGLAHDGSLSQAHAYIDAAYQAGVDAVKFQCHLGDPVSEWRVEPEWEQDEDRAAYWRRTVFTSDQWYGLYSHARDLKLEFMCSPFSLDAVKMLDPYVRLWKVPSGKVTDMALLDAVGATHKPVLLSAGMCTSEEKEVAFARLAGAGTPSVLIMHCTSLYPTPPEAIGLGGRPAGLSDHSGTIYPGIAAVALGCHVLEVHICWSKEQGGFDTAASLDIGQLRQLVAGVRFVEQAMRPVDKDALSCELEPVRRVFMGGGCA